VVEFFLTTTIWRSSWAESRVSAGGAEGADMSLSTGFSTEAA